MSTTQAGDDPRVTDDPWARWGWLMGGVWLGFFVFPLMNVWGGDLPLARQLLSTLLIAIFIGGYVVTVRSALRDVARKEYERASRTGTIGIAVLVVVSLLLGWQIGIPSLTALPFLASMPSFFYEWDRVRITSVGILLGGIVVSWAAFGPWPAAAYWALALVVLMMASVSRLLEERQEVAARASSQLALVEERERVARDVHDVLGHSLTVVTMKTELARRLVDLDPERAKTELAEVEDLSREALAEIRATVGGLRVARIADEVESARVALAGAGITAELPEDLTVVDPRHRITLAWVLREAVTNVVRHSRAGRCHVELGSDRIVVTDDGRGLSGRREGNGLRGLRERVDQAGGTLSIAPADAATGHGTRLEVVL
ncbi:sensor histidine kinase [Ornithinimicrobium sp. Y1847]|uniref:sensor histidine kinase n=1 Tax=Ornithinimicrobium sp. Y1847 TaxID=3405419 RepID=UPI003B67ACE8